MAEVLCLRLARLNLLGNKTQENSTDIYQRHNETKMWEEKEGEGKWVD